MHPPRRYAQTGWIVATIIGALLGLFGGDDCDCDL